MGSTRPSSKRLHPLDGRVRPGHDSTLGSQIVADRKVRSHKVEHFLLSGEEVLGRAKPMAGALYPDLPRHRLRDRP